jgi:hypothetical protein
MVLVPRLPHAILPQLRGVHETVNHGRDVRLRLEVLIRDQSQRL